MVRPPGELHRSPRSRPATSVEAIARLFEPDQDRLGRTPMAAAMLLRAMTFGGTHPMMVEEPIPPAEIVHAVLHGILADTAAEGGTTC
jgi:hypothetical protein